MPDNKIIELTPFRADLARALARRGERLLAATDLADEVAGLEPLEAYYIVREVGLGQALPILLVLSPEQLEACVDLDCWSRHDFAADTLDEWLAAFALAGPEELAKGFFTLDYVVQLLYLATCVTVYDPEMDEVPPQENEEENEPARAMTPDGFYLLELKTELAMDIHPFTVLDALYQYDLAATHQLLSEVRVELPLQLEEEALRFRNGRMQDIGFVTPDEADVLFSRPAAGQPLARPQKSADSPGIRVPSVYAVPLVESSLLQQALALIDDKESLARLEQELVWVINSAIIAYGEKTKETRQIIEIAERVRDTLCLGLEALITKAEPDCSLDSPAAVARAAALLESWYLHDLFRQGFAATQPLQQEARQALREPKVLAWYELTDMEQSDDTGDRLARAFFSALLGRHALHSGFDMAHPEATKAFACLVDVDVARLRLQRLVDEICRHPESWGGS
jgi:hypothetical protein